MYDKPPTTFDEMVAPFPGQVRITAGWLRDLILQAFPQLDERIYGGSKVANALYSVGRTDAVALGLQPGARFVKLFVHDPEHLPASGFKLEGSGKHMRHIKFAKPPSEARDELIAVMRVPVERRS